VADKGGLPFETEQKILPLLFEVVFSEKLIQKITADLGFVGRKSSYFALTKRTVRFRDRTGKKIDRVQIPITRVKKEEIHSIPKDVPIIEIRHQNSRMCDELQLVDLVSGAIFCNYEYSKDVYFKTLKEAGAIFRDIKSYIQD
jgi:hypothetical protein